jgi:hypothetical protein
VPIHKWSFLPCSAFSAGFSAAAYRRTPHRKPLCGLDQDKNYSFLDGHQLLRFSLQTSIWKGLKSKAGPCRPCLFGLETFQGAFGSVEPAPVDSVESTELLTEKHVRFKSP